MDGLKNTLSFYFRILFRETGLGWSGDNQAEIEGVVEGLCKIAKQEALKALREEAERGLKNENNE